MKRRPVACGTAFVMVLGCTIRERITVPPNNPTAASCVATCIHGGGNDDQVFECALRCPGIVQDERGLGEAPCKHVSTAQLPCVERSRSDHGAVGAITFILLPIGLLVLAISQAHAPNCAAAGTPIATPTGDVPIERLAPNDLVLSMHRGRLQAVPVRAVGRTAVHGHVMIELELDNGRTVAMSSGHPTADGRTFGELATTAQLGEARVIAVRRVPYREAFTYDILPDSDTGTYVAAGALVGSTLASTLNPLEPRR